MPNQVPKAEEAIFDGVSQVNRYLRRELSRNGISVSQIRILHTLDRSPGCSLNQVALETGIRKSSASLAIERMVVKKLVRRTTSPKERRSVALKLTPLGERQFKAAKALAIGSLSERLEKLNPAHRALVMQAFVILHPLFELC